MGASNANGWLIGVILLSTAIAGCSAKSGPGTDATASVEKNHNAHGYDHARGEHPHTGPHGGHLIELGQQAYHAELLHDGKAHQVTVYLLDGQAKQGISITQPELTLNMIVAGGPRQFKLAALPQTGDAPGRTSCFQAVNQELCEALAAPDTNGRLNVNVDGKHFVGEIEHHDHDGHEHVHQADRGVDRHK